MICELALLTEPLKKTVNTPYFRRSMASQLWSPKYDLTS